MAKTFLFSRHNKLFTISIEYLFNIAVSVEVVMKLIEKTLMP